MRSIRVPHTMAPGAPHATMVYDPGLVTGVILDAVQAST
jgi:hypothetical protein